MSIFSRRFEKEGKGVEKNAPEKIAFFRFFELYGRSFGKLVTGNLLYNALTIPLLIIAVVIFFLIFPASGIETMLSSDRGSLQLVLAAFALLIPFGIVSGLAEAGLTYICRAAARDRHTFPSSDFFETLKKNKRQAMICGVIDYIVYFFLLYDIYYAYLGLTEAEEVSAFSYVYFGLFLLMFIIYKFSSYYRYSIIISFKIKLTQIFKNSFIFAMASLGSNIIIAISHIVIYVLGFLILALVPKIGATVVFLTYMLLFPAFSCYLKQFCNFPIMKKLMIDPYYEQHPNEDITLRRRLGLLPDEEDTEDDPEGSKTENE